MEFSIELSKPELRVLSAVFSNFVVGWLFAILGSRDLGRIGLDLVLSVAFWYAAVAVEGKLEEV